MIATGRMYVSVKPYADALGLDVPLVTYNGALVKGSKSGKVYSLISVTKKQSAIKNSAVSIPDLISQPGRQEAVAPMIQPQPLIPNTHRTIFLRNALHKRKESNAEQSPTSALPSTVPPRVTTVMNEVL